LSIGLTPGIAKLYTAAPSLTNPTARLPGYVRVHYHRTDGNYGGWTIYAFYDTTEYTGDYNSGLVPVTNADAYGVYFDVAGVPNAQNPRAASRQGRSAPEMESWPDDRQRRSRMLVQIQESTSYAVLQQCLFSPLM
jgi:hypothetical protein